jgi:hypothetical protein
MAFSVLRTAHCVLQPVWPEAAGGVSDAARVIARSSSGAIEVCVCTPPPPTKGVASVGIGAKGHQLHIL